MKEQEGIAVPRIIGNYKGAQEGPLLVVTAGVHGNEASGVRALQKIFSELEASKPAIKGSFLGIAGNQEALKRGKRFIDEDLNRTWTQENLQLGSPESHEQREMREIIKVLEDFPKETYPQRYFVDCHTTSSESLPYISVQVVGENDAFAHRFQVHKVRGFSDIVNGSIDKHLSLKGFTGFTFEGGQHFSESTQANQEAMIWLALMEANQLEIEKISCYPECVEIFSTLFPEGPKTFKILYRHGIGNDDDFKMEPGFKNFDPIEKGQLLAQQNGKEIRSDWNATIFMPLYQAQGNDGFFVIEEAASMEKTAEQL